MSRPTDRGKNSPRTRDTARPEPKTEEASGASARPGGQILTVKELAAHLRVHPNTIYRYAKSGRIPCFRVGDEWRFNFEIIERWLQEQKDPWKQ